MILLNDFHSQRWFLQILNTTPLWKQLAASMRSHQPTPWPRCIAWRSFHWKAAGLWARRQIGDRWWLLWLPFFCNRLADLADFLSNRFVRHLLVVYDWKFSWFPCNWYRQTFKSIRGGVASRKLGPRSGYMKHIGLSLCTIMLVISNLIYGAYCGYGGGQNAARVVWPSFCSV